MNIKEALSILKDHGYKQTDKREKILQFFSEHNRYLTAKNVLEYLKDDFPSLSYDTVYRNLYLFVELKILEATDMKGEKHFRFSCETKEHHHHFICTICGKTKQVHACPMNMLDADMEEYEITGHKFEIYGHCPDCINHSSGA